MSEKCNHATTIEQAHFENVSIHLCTWECRKTVIDVKKNKGIAVSLTVDEFISLQSERDEAVSIGMEIGKNCVGQRLEIEQLKKVEANYDALQSPMPCGHLARYAVNADEGTQYCVMCVLEATQLTITNLVNDDEPESDCPFCQTRATLKRIEVMLDTTPEINSKHYDDVIANLINDVSSANSTFQCYCEENKHE